MPHASDFIDSPLPGPDAWAAAFDALPIPVLGATADALDALRADEDRADANRIGEAVAADPLATLAVLAHAARHRPPRLVTDPQTVTAVAVLTGIGPFFSAFGGLPRVEARLGGVAGALAALDAAVARARRAAWLAFGLALQRAEGQAALVHQAALLHDLAGLLLRCHAPRLAAAVDALGQGDPALAAADAERQVLDTDLASLGHALAERWRLSALLQRPPAVPRTPLPAALCVALGVRLAGNAPGAALPDALLDDLGGFLGLAREQAAQAAHDLDAG